MTAPKPSGDNFATGSRLSYLVLLFLALPVQSATIAEKIHEGRVVKIADGDTLTLLVKNQQLRIRLSEIDTPERKQPFGTKAKQALSDLAFGKQARVVEVTVDCCGRIMGRVYDDEFSVNVARD